MQEKTPSLLERSDDFANRHIGPNEKEIDAMLATLGVGSLEELLLKTVPASIRTTETELCLLPKSEHETLSLLRKMAGKNKVRTSMLGMGYYGTILPEVIRRNVLENPGWYTAYTPYQAEVSQGRLEILLAFEQMVTDLTKMEIANASLLDEATAAAEGMAMAHRVVNEKQKGGKRNLFVVDCRCHPHTIAVLKTRAHAVGIELVFDISQIDAFAERIFGALVQYPDTFGEIYDLSSVTEKLHAHKALCVVATDLLALTLLKPPGEMGADIVVGSTQRFGMPMGFGGPHAAFFAGKEEHKRHIPGRIIGVSKDAHGNMALRMALQTREQHIRREKATSNICTAQVLPAILSTLYAMYHGPEGLREIAERTHRLTMIAAIGLHELGYSIGTECFFDTFTLSASDEKPFEYLGYLSAQYGLNVRFFKKPRIGISIDETMRRNDVERLWALFCERNGSFPSIEKIDAYVLSSIPENLRRESPYLTHPIFNSYHSETEMMRYLRRLAAKDITLDRSMIPLGSCTMKLNAASEMTPVTWGEFSNLHPFCDKEDSRGYKDLIESLQKHLCAITGFDAFSFQPNAGSQGEFTGLLVIKKYHESHGDSGRTVCLIPASAHGTNPASATMAGLSVVVVKCDANGNVDIADLKEKTLLHKDTLACLMITYPSTHGVFEEGIVEICDIVHAHGGQVYMDGANMNALVGIAKPAEIGADVSHLNLHKTFCIPHGGGGPGMGPIGVKKHLVSFLPNHSVVSDVGGESSVGAVSAAPWSSASILPITLAYIMMMGSAGLKKATEVAILNANYIATRLAPHYPVLYRGKEGMVAHECIIDLRPLQEKSGVTVEDVAKRLIDYGFHAPTVSFPVAGTLMIEPTESESKNEIDRFCDALIMIRKEIQHIEDGKYSKENNPLKNAPHTLKLACASTWELPYTREEACFPAPWCAEDKYWPPVGRVDNVYGDRNLMCACPSIDSYAEK